VKTSISLLISSLLFNLILTTNALADDPFTKGKAAYDKGDYQGAIEQLREAVRKDRKNVQAYRWLGTAYFKVDSLNEAEKAVIQAKALDTTDASLYELQGDVYLKQKLYPAAIDQYRQSATLDKKNAALYLKLGETCRIARQYKEAAEAYISVLLIDSVNVTALRELGTIYFRAKQYASALPIFRDLVKLQPDSIGYQITYVKILNETKYYPDLIPIAEGIMAKDSTNADIKDILCNAYIETKQFQKAQICFASMKIDSTNREELIKRAKALKNLEMYTEAIKFYELAYKLDTASADIYYDMATVYNKLEQYPQAITMFDKKIVADSTPSYQWACYLQGAQSYAKLKEFKKAKEYVLKSIESKPDYFNGWYLLGQYNGQLGLTQEQVKAYKTVIDLISKADTAGNGTMAKNKTILDEIYRTLGTQFMNEKKYSEAIEYFKKALVINPKDCALNLAVGSLYQRDKKDEEAKSYYCKVIQLCPNSEQGKNAQQGLRMMGMECGK
jgi:tetratricopeptide (TPR) repeat protein